MLFFCHRIKDNVESAECIECCDEYQDCKDSGFFDIIKRLEGTRSDKHLVMVRKWIERAWSGPKYPSWNSLKIHGTVSTDFVGVIPDKEKIIAILTENGHTLDAEKLYWATRSYFIERAIWKKNAVPGEYKMICKKLEADLSQLQKTLEQLICGRRDIQGAMPMDIQNTIEIDSGVDLSEYTINTTRLRNNVEAMAAEKSNALSHLYPAYQYIRTLSEIFEKETGQEPTATDGQLYGQPSDFVMLVHDLLKEFSPYLFQD